MRRPILFIIPIFLVVVYSLSLNGAASQNWILPGAAETKGLFGAHFSSTLYITNSGDTGAAVQISFIPYAGKSVPAPANLTVAAGGTVRVDHCLQTLFGLVADAGTLTLESSSPLVIWMSTANIANPAGSYGLALKPLSTTTLLNAGSKGDAIWISQDSHYRTNLALLLLDPNTSVKVSVFDENDQLRGTNVVSSPTPVSWQTSLTNLIGSGELSLGRAELEVVTGKAAGYAAVVDNNTNDGIAVMAESLGTNGSDLLLNGVVRTAGANNTFWRTDVRLFNPNDHALEISIESLGVAAGNGMISKLVPAHSLMELMDVLGPGGFGFPEGSAGALRFHASQSFMLAGRTSNIDPQGVRPGTYSAYQQAVPFDAGLLQSSQIGVFSGIQQKIGNTGYRTNLAFLAGAAGATGNLTLRDSVGNNLGTMGFSFMFGEWVQKNIGEWFGGISIPDNARVDVQVSSGSLDGYASRIDNGTGDAVVLPLTLIQSPSDPGNGPQISGCPIFPSDNPWNRDISNDPVDPNSSNYIAHMNGNTKFLHPDFGSNPTYGIPYTVVPGSQTKVPMTFDYADESDPGPYPIPPNPPIEGGNQSSGDRHVLVLDRDNCLLYETWDSHFVGPGWHCGSGAIFNLRSNSLRPDGWTSADAAGLPILPGLARYDEAVTIGEIKHALRFTIQSTQRAYIHPATHYASGNTDPNAPPMGLKVRLKANYDLTRFTGASRVILTALKKYGMLVADNGSDWFITGATDSSWNDGDLNQLKTVPGNAFEVVQTGAIIK